MNHMFITITGQNHYLGMNPFKVGRIVMLIKEPENNRDSEAIRVELPYIETIGYVANSANTVFAGTHSAGRLYDKIEKYAFAQVMFITHSSVIALVISEGEAEQQGVRLTKDEMPAAQQNSVADKKAKIGF